MKARVVVRFSDKKEQKMREIGEEFEVTKKRFKEINSTKHGVLVEEVNEEPKIAAKE